MGNACFKPAAADAASAASTFASKPHPELTSSSPDSKRVSAASHFDSPGRSPKSAKAGAPQTLDDGLAAKHDAEDVLVQEDSILSCTCSDVISSPHLEGAFAARPHHSRSASPEQSPQAGPSAAAAAAPARSPAADARQHGVTVTQRGECSATSDGVLRDNAMFMPLKADSLRCAAGHAQGGLEGQVPAVARACGHADDAGDATSGILGVRDACVLRGSPFADSDDLGDGTAASDGLFDGAGGGGDSVRFEMGPRSEEHDDVVTPRFSLQWERQHERNATKVRRPHLGALLLMFCASGDRTLSMYMLWSRRRGCRCHVLASTSVCSLRP